MPTLNLYDNCVLLVCYSTGETYSLYCSMPCGVVVSYLQLMCEY